MNGSPRARPISPRRRPSRKRATNSPQAPRTALGKGRKEIRVRYTGRQGNARRAVRRQEPADRLSLHARPRLGGRLSELFLSRRPFRRPDHPSGAARRTLCRRLPRAVAEIEKFKARMGWKFKWVSSFGSDFNFDYQVSVSPEERPAARCCTITNMDDIPERRTPGASVFFKNQAGEVFHTYSSYGRGLECSSALTISSTSPPKAATRRDFPFPWHGSAITTAMKAPSSIQKRHISNRNPPHAASSTGAEFISSQHKQRRTP